MFNSVTGSSKMGMAGDEESKAQMLKGHWCVIYWRRHLHRAKYRNPGKGNLILQMANDSVELTCPSKFST